MFNKIIKTYGKYGSSQSSPIWYFVKTISVKLNTCVKTLNFPYVYASIYMHFIRLNNLIYTSPKVIKKNFNFKPHTCNTNIYQIDFAIYQIKFERMIPNDKCELINFPFLSILTNKHICHFPYLKLASFLNWEVQFFCKMY